MKKGMLSALDCWRNWDMGLLNLRERQKRMQ